MPRKGVRGRGSIGLLNMALDTGAPLVSVALGGLIAASLMLQVGVSPVRAFQALLAGAFGSLYAVGMTLVCSAPVILTGLAVIVAYKSGLINIGGEGQLQVGALGATLTAVATGSLPLSLIAGCASGAVWGGIAGSLRVWRNVNEIISTMMLNFIGTHLVHNLILSYLKDPEASHPCTFPVPVTARLPVMIAGTRVHAGVLIAVLACVAVYLLFRHTVLGFEIRMAGANAEAATHAGVSVARRQVAAMLMAGAAAGLAGAGEVLGVQYRLGLEWSRGWGFPGVAVAFLARNHPLGAILAGLFYGTLDAGSTHMQAVTGLPSALVSVIQGLPVVILIAINSWQRLRLRSMEQHRLQGLPAAGE